VRSIQDRIRGFRRIAAELVGEGSAATAAAPPAINTARRAAAARAADASKARGQVTASAFAVKDEENEAAADDDTMSVPRTPMKPKTKKDSAKGSTYIKLEKDIEATPTPAARVTTTGLPTPSIKSTTYGTNKRKLSSTTFPMDNSEISSSEEAVSTDAADSDVESSAAIDSPTPAVKKARTSYTRTTKLQEGGYAKMDGADSSEDDVVATGGDSEAVWQKQRERKRKQVKVVRDDSDEDWIDSGLDFM
jgi:hypothetical protein